MKKILYKFIRSDIFEEKYFLRIEDVSKNYFFDKQVTLEEWNKYEDKDEYIVN